MVSAKHFKIKIDHDGYALLVSITHTITGLERSACPLPGASIQAVQTQLMHELLDQFCGSNEFILESGSCEIGGKRGSFLRITHTPTGRSKASVYTGNRSSQEVREELRDLLEEELWREGIRPQKQRKNQKALHRQLNQSINQR